MLLLWYGFLGGVIGGAYGFEGAFSGLIFGFIAGGVVYSARRSSEKTAQERISYLESIIKGLRSRIDGFEKDAGKTSPAPPLTPAQTTPAPPPPVTSAPKIQTAAFKQEELSRYMPPDLSIGQAKTPTPPPPTPAKPPGLVPDLSLPKSAPLSPTRSYTPPPPRPPQEPPAFIRFIRDFFTGGNLVVKIAVIILFFGVSFALKLAADQGYFPIELRLAAVAVGAVALIVVGWRLRLKRPDFALVLQGGGIGIFYLTTFAAFKLPAVGLSPLVAFGTLVLTVILANLLAIGQDALWLALAGFCGGYLAPVLISTGSGNHVALFSYYAVLNAGVFGVAWFKSWRPLNILGFLFTFGVGSAWGYQYYRPENLASTEPFLVLFFLFYTFTAVIFAFKQRPQLKGFVDGTLVFGTPLIAFTLQVGLVREIEKGLAFSALSLGFFYLLLAWILFKRSREVMRDLSESFLALGVIFGTLTIPLALDAQWTSASWAIEGAGLVWIGVRQKRLLARLFGTLLIFTAGFQLVDLLRIVDRDPPLALMPVFNGMFFGCLIKALSALFAARLLSKNRIILRGEELLLAPILAIWGTFWWYYGGVTEIQLQVPEVSLQATLTGFIAVSFIAGEFLATRLVWQDLRTAGRLLSIACIPFSLDRDWTSLSWTTQGAYLAWSGRRHASDTVKLLAGGLILIAGYAGFEVLRSHFFDTEVVRDLPVLLNHYYLGGAVRSLTALFAAYQLWRGSKETRVVWLSPVLLAWGLGWWFQAGSCEIDLKAPPAYRVAMFLTYVSATLAVCEFLRSRLSWDHMKTPAQILLPFLFVFVFFELTTPATIHPLRGGGYLAWPIAIIAHLWILYRHEGMLSGKRLQFMHAGWWWLFVLLLTWEGSWWLKDLVPDATTWAGACKGFLPAVSILFTATVALRIAWPFGRHGRIYLGLGLMPVVSFFLCWMWLMNLSQSGAAKPLPYVPFLNPLDLAMGFGMVAMIVWRRRLVSLALSVVETPLERVFVPALSTTLFVWLTAILVRTIHHWTDVPFDYGSLYASMVVQTALSIFWSIYAFSAMVLATRAGKRALWIAGAFLLGVVVLKLFIVDLDNRATVWRIVSFIGVGLLMLFIGYFSPLPPRAKLAEANK